MSKIMKGGDAVELSTDINVITAEVNSYKQIAGQAIFEIGYRLKHARDRIFNKLENGKSRWNDWCENELDFTRRHANRFIKVYEELGKNGTPVSHLGIKMLYEIATLPPEEREREHTLKSGEMKTVDEMTVRELREVKEQLKKEKELRQKAEREYETVRDTLESIGEQTHKTEYVESIPDDYEQIKAENEQYRQLFGESRIYLKDTRRVTNGDAVTYAVLEFSNDIRKFIEKYGYLTHFPIEFESMVDEGKAEYLNSITELQRFLRLMEKSINTNDIINC